jgi:small subunit ribosomal protein S1
LEPDPWQEIGDRYKRGTQVKGKILRKIDFGAFVEIEDGIEGLLHSSQLAIGTSLGDRSLEVGEEIEAWVRELDPDRHRLSLTMREVPEGDPWEDVEKRYEEGDLKEGVVEQVSRHGFFVALEPGLTGLLPFSAVSAPAGRRREQAYRPGQKVTVSIMELDPKRQRISLGLEGARAEGSKADLNAFRRSQRSEGSGMGALAAAFEKLKQQ